MNRKIKIAICGAGFWAQYQVAAWKELPEAEIISVCDIDAAKADVLATKFDIHNSYNNLDDLLANECPDVVDIITDAASHYPLIKKTATAGVHVICQKPLATSLSQAAYMLELCRKAGVQLLVHENFRWQRPVRRVKELLSAGVIGEPFKSRISFCSAFRVFQNQPLLAELEQFILTDVGTHVLDICRFLHGEALSVYCQTNSVNEGIKGEDVATVFMKMRTGVQCVAEMSYASILEKESFPQTLILIEGTKGSLMLTNDFVIKITTREGTTIETIKPKQYPWAHHSYAVVHSSIVDCNNNLLKSLQGITAAETSGEDNYQTLKLVYAAYESATTNNVINL